MNGDITCVFEGVAGVGAIYISNLKTAQNATLLKKLSIKAIVTAVKGGVVKHTKEDVTDHIFIPVYDDPRQNMSKYFDQTYQFIDNVRKKTNVLVHCYAGVSRSATIVIAYLLRKYNYSLQNVISMVKRRRSKINPNHGFIEQLKQEAIKMGIPPLQTQKDTDKILNPQTSRPHLSPQKRRAISAFAKRQTLTKPPFIMSKLKEKQARNSQSTSVFLNKKNQNSPQMKDQTPNKEEMSEEYHKQKIYSLTPVEMNLNYCSFSQICEKRQTEKINTERTIQSKYSPKKGHAYSKSTNFSQPLQQSRLMNPKMAEKIEKFKEKVLLMEEQKKNRRSSSDLMSKDLQKPMKQKKIVFDQNPFCFQSIILSKKLQAKQQNESPLLTQSLWSKKDQLGQLRGSQKKMRSQLGSHF